MYQKAILSLLLAFGVSSAFANPNASVDIKLQEGESSGLGPCGGYAVVGREHGTLVLTISNSHNCSNILMNGKQIGKLRGGRGSQSIGLDEHIGHKGFRYLLHFAEALLQQNEAGTIFTIFNSLIT